ncbi:hypothetical protein KOEU_34490 [Komagataeibacter europaeus]|uniref:Uncharacterized protein n=1 Tax=Komagataeibacter europaeus TaxID=33995 RepID=A0A0M0ECQ1_KOMEU|nr:hypothetical protein KOEU_34490 [Komagataeibacter europaeus]
MRADHPDHPSLRPFVRPNPEGSRPGDFYADPGRLPGTAKRFRRNELDAVAWSLMAAPIRLLADERYQHGRNVAPLLAEVPFHFRARQIAMNT